MQFQYKLEFGSYCWYGATGRMEHMSDEVAIVFDDDPDLHGPVMLKHGDPARVQAWWDDTKRKYRDAGAEDLTRDWKMASGKLDLEELNKAISISGYRPKFLPREVS